MSDDRPLLLVDAGNSRIKWAEGTLNGVSSIQAIENRKIESELPRLWSTLTAPRSVWLSNSAGEVRQQQIEAIAEACWGVTVETVRSAERFGVLLNGYDQPQQLGVDRWLGMVAAWQRYRRSFCLVDCGTATTIDLVDDQGQHQGGVILPGIHSDLETLLKRVPHLKEAALSSPAEGLGRSTLEGLRDSEGEVVGAVEQLLERLQEAFGHFERLVTGGEAEVLIQSSSGRYERLPELVLEGLNWVARSDHSRPQSAGL